MTGSAPTLGIIAGSGWLPRAIADRCREEGRACFVLGFEETTDMTNFAHLPHAVVRLGAVGEAIAQLQQAGAKELVLAGALPRPSWTSLMPDALGARLLARLSTKFLAGDDALLRVVMGFLEEQGFTLVAADSLLDSCLMPQGALGTIAPSAEDKKDIEHGFRVARTLGALDIGQAVIVERGFVLGVEAAEGTDALIARTAGLKREPRGGVLVKAKKPQQDRRADLPAIGVKTIETIADAGFSGIALEAGHCLILDKDRAIAAANARGVFVVGM